MSPDHTSRFTPGDSMVCVGNFLGGAMGSLGTIAMQQLQVQKEMVQHLRTIAQHGGFRQDSFDYGIF